MHSYEWIHAYLNDNRNLGKHKDSIIAWNSSVFTLASSRFGNKPADHMSPKTTQSNTPITGFNYTPNQGEVKWLLKKNSLLIYIVIFFIIVLKISDFGWFSKITKMISPPKHQLYSIRFITEWLRNYIVLISLKASPSSNWAWSTRYISTDNY